MCDGYRSFFGSPLFFQTNIEKGEGSFLASKSILEDALSFHLKFLTDIKVKVCMILKGSEKKKHFVCCATFFVKKCVIEVATNYFIESYYGLYHGIDLVGFKCSE